MRHLPLAWTSGSTAWVSVGLVIYIMYNRGSDLLDGWLDLRCYYWFYFLLVLMLMMVLLLLLLFELLLGEQRRCEPGWRNGIPFSMINLVQMINLLKYLFCAMLRYELWSEGLDSKNILRTFGNALGMLWISIFHLHNIHEPKWNKFVRPSCLLGTLALGGTCSYFIST